jgi:hypothetical protein
MVSPAIERVAIAAHDAGGARALFPVAEELRRRGVEVLALVAGPAVKIWREEAAFLPAFEAEDEESVDVLARKLGESRVDLLISASGLYNQFEHRARLAARQAGLPIVAVLDSWLNYAERFEREMGGVVVASRPDVICAIDEWTREGAVAAGFDPSAVVVTGHPDLEKTARECRAGSEDERRQLRREAGVSEGGVFVVFFSDPFYVGPNLEFYSGPGALMHPDGRPIFGYTVREILPAVLRELDAAMIAENTSCDFVVRPHPWEHEAALRKIIDETSLERVRVRLEKGSTVTRWIRCADVLMGMMTIALLHAALGGKPSISVEIGLPESGQEDPCVSNILGYTRGVFDHETLRAVCRQIARQEYPALKTEPKYLLPLEGAAVRVADVVLGSTASHRPVSVC